jgi:elongation factor P
MEKIEAVALKPGYTVMFNNKLCVVTRVHHVQPGRRASLVQAEMKDAMTGTKYNQRFISDNILERVRLDEAEYQFLYASGDEFTFMHQETFEQVVLDKDNIGEDQVPFLQENMVVTIQMHDGKPISVMLPETVILTVEQTEPVIKGQTASSSYKPATADNGARVMVPPFVEAGERIVVRISDATYVERAKN